MSDHIQEKHPEPAALQHQPNERMMCPQAYGIIPPEDDEIDLLELWNILWEGKWLITGFTFLATLAAVIVTLFVLPVIYKSEAVLMPTEQSASGGLSGLAGGLLGMGMGMGAPSGKTSQILAFLNSRDLKQRLIEKYDLLPRYNPDMWDQENQRWLTDDPTKIPSLVMALQSDMIGGFLSVNQSKDSGLISISWEDEDPAFAALMVNRMIAELRHFLDHEYESDAKREREFTEGQVATTTQVLEYWEQQVPTHEMTMARIQRERATVQAIYTELRKQLELAKINEAKEVISFKVLDQPLVPELRFKPKRTLLCAITMVAAGFMSVFIVFGIHAVKKIRNRN